MLKAPLSRRTFLQFTAAASAATLPAAAEAAFGNVESVPLTDEQALDACIGQLKNILARMHPLAEPAAHWARSQDDGGFWFTLRASPAFQEFDGDGLYMLSCDGYRVPYWLQAAFQKNANGEVVNQHFWGYQWIDNPFDGGEQYFAEPRYFGEPSIIRKLDMPDGITSDDVPFGFARY